MRRAAVVAATVGALALTAIVGGPAAVGAPVEAHPVNPATGVALSPCFSDDNGDPHLMSFRLSRTQVDVRERSRRIRISAQARDEGGPGAATGIRSIGGTLTTPGGDAGYAPSVIDFTLLPDANGVFIGNLRIPRQLLPGTWEMGVGVTDGAGNGEYWTSAQLAAAGLQSAVHVTSRRDLRGPVLDDVHLSTNRVNTAIDRHWVRVSVLARDIRSGVASVTADLGAAGRDTGPTGALHLVVRSQGLTDL